MSPVLSHPSNDPDRWLDQTVLHNADEAIQGNCTQAAVASLLGLPLTEVPNFIELTTTTAGFWAAVEEFLHSRGYYLDYMQANNYRPPVLYLASGPSPRGLPHMVVMYGDQLWHDPHPSKQGLVKIEYLFLVVPHDPHIALRSTPKD